VLKIRHIAKPKTVSCHPKPATVQKSTDEQMTIKANAQKNKRGATNRTKPTLLHHICFLPTAPPTLTV